MRYKRDDAEVVVTLGANDKMLPALLREVAGRNAVGFLVAFGSGSMEGMAKAFVRQKNADMLLYLSQICGGVRAALTEQGLAEAAIGPVYVFRQLREEEAAGLLDCSVGVALNANAAGVD